MSKGDNDDLPELLRSLGRYQRQINAELAKAKPDQAKIARAYAAGKDFARDAAPYCHSFCRIFPAQVWPGRRALALASIISMSNSARR
jgi:hypothetical protein